MPHNLKLSLLTRIHLERGFYALVTLLSLMVAPSLAQAQQSKATSYRPILTQALGETAIQPFAHLASKTEWASAYSMTGNQGDVASNLGVDLLARVGVRFHTMKALAPTFIALQLEGDLPTGYLTSPLPYSQQPMPHSTPIGIRLRRAGVKVGYQDLIHVSAGISTPQWGLGLIYNSGEDRWDHGKVRFAVPREGDRALRAIIGTGKLTPLRLKMGLGWEMPLQPEEPLELQSIHNLLLSATIEPSEESSLGVLLNIRLGSERSAMGLGHWLADAFAKLQIPLGSLQLALALEVAMEGGNSDDPLSGDLRYGGVLRTQLGSKTWGIGLDAVYASKKTQQTAGFRLDQNLSLGWLMFPYVTRINHALDSSASGDRGALNEAIENVLTGQFKVHWRPMDSVEIIGGSLIAFQPTGANESSHWTAIGNEFDLGLRWRTLFSGMECTLGVDGSVVLPLDLLGTDDITFGARFVFDYRL